MEPIPKLIHILESEEGHDGLLTFLQNADLTNIKFEGGEPTTPIVEGVKTYVSLLPDYANSVVLLFYPLWGKIDFVKIAAKYMIGGFKRADENILMSIGMAPDRCHPFPDLRYLENNTIDLLCIEDGMAKETTPHNFPVYSTTTPARIGSIYVPPKLYFETMYTLIGDKIRKLDMLSDLDIIEFRRDF